MAEGDQRELQEMLEGIQSELGKFGKERSNLIPILQKIQDTYLYLPAEALSMVGEHLGIPVAEVYGVATFYNQFRFYPPGRHPVKVCLGTACHVRGGDIILENFERKLEIKEGEKRVACVGCCALAPVALMGDTVHGHMAPSKVEGLVLRVEVEKEKAEREKEKQQQNA
ncbi:MAG: NAD(P)H-dependent oxidoreductase subunit E [Deltaproteobacteria bacterium]|nr:NAD(P)H-dependent oxidoreductase subunit E [Deltaproteobacteria bacterium]